MRLRSSAGATQIGTVAESVASPLDKRLGAILARDGYVRPTDVDAILDRQVAEDAPFGETAVSMGLISPEVLEFSLEKQGGGQMLMPGDPRGDPLLVAAFDLNDPYVVNARTICSRIVRHRADLDDRRLRSCVLIGFDCDEEVAVLAANLAIVMVRMHMPTLLLDANRGYPRLHELFRIAPDSAPSDPQPAPGVDAAPQPTAIPQLWVIPAIDGASRSATPYERQPILERVRGLNLQSMQLIATMSLDQQGSTATMSSAVTGVDTVMLVARKHVTAIADIRGLIDGIDECGVSIAGLVLV